MIVTSVMRELNYQVYFSPFFIGLMRLPNSKAHKEMLLQVMNILRYQVNLVKSSLDLLTSTRERPS